MAWHCLALNWIKPLAGLASASRDRFCTIMASVGLCMRPKRAMALLPIWRRLIREVICVVRIRSKRHVNAAIPVTVFPVLGSIPIIVVAPLYWC